MKSIVAAFARGAILSALYILGVVGFVVWMLGDW